MNEKIKTIADYDGWELCVTGILYEKIGTNQPLQYLDNLPYLTSLDWLHPVAMKVMEGIRAKELELIDYYNNQPFHVDGDVNQEVIYGRQKVRIGRLITNILLACSNRPINGEYIDLFNAVYDGIVYLKSQNNGNNS
jgi:hypothetical protein